MREGQRQQKTISVIDETPHRSGYDSHQGYPDIRQMNQAETHSSDNHWRQQKAFWDKREQAAQQIELKQRLLHQSPRQVAAERGENIPIDNPPSHGGPTAGFESQNSPDGKEQNRRRHRHPEKDADATLKPVLCHWC